VNESSVGSLVHARADTFAAEDRARELEEKWEEVDTKMVGVSRNILSRTSW
jgi:hypothetical protein